jgi:hypothetical protein
VHRNRVHPISAFMEWSKSETSDFDREVGVRSTPGEGG